MLLAVILLATAVGMINPGFFSLFNVFSILKNSTVIGLFAIGFFLVLVVGGLDVSFAAIGSSPCTARSSSRSPSFPMRRLSFFVRSRR